MRFSKVAFVTLLFALVVVTAAAQQDKPSTTATQELIDKAHQDMLKGTADKAAEAGRMTEAFARSLPQTGDSGFPVARKNYIDEHIFGRIERDKIPHSPRAGDEEFLRRAYLDATGLLPDAAKVREFL